MKPGVLVRALVKDDAAQWRELRLEALRTYPLAFASAYEEALEQDLSSRIPAPDERSVLLGAWQDGVLVGSAGLFVPDGIKQRHKGHLWGMYVTPALHRHGVGAKLVQAAIEHARSRVALIELVVLHANEPAKALYRGFGFVTYGVEKRALRHQGVDHDDELMALDLQNGL